MGRIDRMGAEVGDTQDPFVSSAGCRILERIEG